jgi:hypothetical protein
VADFFVSWAIYYSGVGAVNQLKRGFRTDSRCIRVTTKGVNSKTILIYLRRPREISFLHSSVLRPMENNGVFKPIYKTA